MLLVLLENIHLNTHFTATESNNSEAQVQSVS